ncbi:hypothetical protein [Acinetobacter baumannii]|uniref:hypothetical protein n=1 Tax=Acinetobacter baumannii TaxID=470 RepID=UPI0002AEB196|nr:hypothetical protein [Acinetobacter baumannii]ELW88216.1 hypothetical protein ACINAA014_2577 [Acinetobacter baumannii AA-014]
MTVQVTDRLSQLYVGNGVNTRFDFTFRIFDQEDETGVAVRIKVGNEFEFLDETKYTVTINPDNLGGYVNFLDAPDAQTYFYIAGKTPVDQLLDITNYDNFYPDAIERALDKLTAILQEWKHLVDFETQARILADLNYDQLAQQREAELKAYIDGIASAIIGQPVVGLPAQFVQDGSENQKQINDKTIQSINCVADISNFKPRKNGQIIYLKSYHLGKATGWGYLEYDQTSAEVANNVTTFTSSYGGIWRRQQKDQKEIYAVDGGVLFDGVTDNTDAYRRICSMLSVESAIKLSHGTSKTHFFELPYFGCRIVGADLTHSTIKLIDATDYIGWKDYNFFENFRASGKGVFEAGTYLFRDTRPDKDTKADCDIFWKNCYFSESEYISDGFGRGFKFDNCQDYNIRYAWLKADFPPNFISNGVDNNTLETAFRGFVFNNCRRHYAPAYFLENLGYNAANIQGIQITDTWLEGGGRFVLGYLRDAIISGTCGYHRNASWKYFELTGGENVTISGNTFAKMRTGTTESNAFLTSAKAIKGLTITGNTFHGVSQEIVRLAHSGEESSNVDIENNTYVACFSSGAAIFNITSGSMRNLTVKEKEVVAPSSNWIPVRRTSGINVVNHTIDVSADGSSYVHNFSRVNSLGSTKKQGIYNGTGNTLTQTVIVGYEPRNIRVTGSDGTICILPYGTNALANGLAIGTAQDFTATGNANKSGVTYFWETD